jgi:hypothetical protein
MNVAKFYGFKVDVSSIEIHKDSVAFDIKCDGLTISVDLPTVSCQYDTTVNHTSDPQNEHDVTIDSQEVAKVKTTYYELAVGKVIYFDDEVFAIDDQPVLIDDHDVSLINQVLKEHAIDNFSKEQ